MNGSATTNGNSESGSGWIAVVDDDAALRELILTALSLAGYAARGAESAEKALEFFQEEQPALVITDIVLPGQSGYELCRILRERFGDRLPVLFVSGIRTEAFDVTAGFLIGGDDYIVKPFEPGEIVVRVRRALARSAVSSIRNTHTEGHDLTAREREVLGLLAEGLSQKQIAALLVISSTTVATHIQRILGKLQLHSRAEAVAWAYRTNSFGDSAEPTVFVRRSDARNGNS